MSTSQTPPTPIEFYQGPGGFRIPKRPKQNGLTRLDVYRAAAGNPELQTQILGLCAADLTFWVNLFAYTFVVQRVGKDGKPLTKGGFSQHVPFITWPVQDDALEALQTAIDGGSDVLIDKSRDMGASWLCLAVAVWYWLFRADSQIMLTSRTEDLVDRAGDPDTLYWKIDYILANLPVWMLPCEMPKLQRGGEFRSHMHLGNPANGSNIDGQATTEHIARGGRRLFVLFDEMASMQGAEAAWRSAADSTNCRIANSTPIGPGTEFTRLRNAGLVTGSPRIVTLGYWDHPDKGRGREERIDEDGGVTGIAGRRFWWSPWFEEQRKRRTLSDLGQNILIDHTTAGNLFYNSTIVTQHMAAHGREPIRCDIDPAEFQVDVGPLTAMGMGTQQTIRQKQTLRGRFVPSATGQWFVWAALDEHGRPTQDTNYLLFADPSNGKGAANSTIAAMDANTGEVVAEFADPNCSPSDLAEEMCVAGGTVFAGAHGKAFLGWEVNGPGESMYKDVLRAGYRYVYYKRPVGKAGEPPTKQYGWQSGRREKRVLLAGLETAMKRGEFVCHSRPGLSEMLEYVFFDDGSIGPGTLRDETTGARDAHGDRVIAYAGCVMLRAEVAKFVPPEKRPEQVPGTAAAMFGTPETIAAKRAAEKARNKPFAFGR